jgi:hypothetical protein
MKDDNKCSDGGDCGIGGYCPDCRWLKTTNQTRPKNDIQSNCLKLLAYTIGLIIGWWILKITGII